MPYLCKMQLKYPFLLKIARRRTPRRYCWNVTNWVSKNSLISVVLQSAKEISALQILGAWWFFKSKYWIQSISNGFLGATAKGIEIFQNPLAKVLSSTFCIEWALVRKNLFFECNRLWSNWRGMTRWHN